MPAIRISQAASLRLEVFTATFRSHWRPSSMQIPASPYAVFCIFTGVTLHFCAVGSSSL
jgi:hypothetical protein